MLDAEKTELQCSITSTRDKLDQLEQQEEVERRRRQAGGVAAVHQVMFALKGITTWSCTVYFFLFVMKATVRTELSICDPIKKIEEEYIMSPYSDNMLRKIILHDSDTKHK